MGFVASKYDSSLFVRQRSDGLVCILLYVDDLVITGPELDEIGRVKSRLSNAFEMKNLGDVHYFLGIEVIRTPDGISLSQRHYVLNMLYKLRADVCVQGRVDIMGGRVCTRPRGRYGRTYVDVSGVRACVYDRVEILGVHACARLREHFRMYAHVMVA